MKTITIFGLIYSQHVSNFVGTMKKYSDFRFLGLNKKENVIHGEAYFKQSKDAFDEIYDLPRNKYHILDLIQRAILSFGVIGKYAKKSDIVQFHFISTFVLPLALIVKIVSKAKISSFIYGSDLLRANKMELWCIARVFSISDSIVCDSSLVLDELQRRFPKYTSKMSRLYFGSPIIDRLMNAESGYSEHLIDSKGKKVIMCGYNDSKGQQHLRIIDSLKEVAKDFYWVFPMTYGDKDKEYINKVRITIEKQDADYVILDHFLTDEEWTNCILSTDVFIHMQVSDAFSSSIAEHLLLGHILINGSWLPYKDLDDNGIFYISSNFEDLQQNLLKAISDYSVIEGKLKSNKDKIVRMKSLDYCIRNYWIPYFQEL